VRSIWALARAVPPATLARYGYSAVRQRTRAVLERRRDAAAATHATAAATLPGFFYRIPPLDLLRGDQDWLAGVSALYLDHCFDLLGSGWTHVRHGMTCRGTEGHRYPPEPAVTPDSQGLWLGERLPPAAVAEGQRVWQLVDAGYQPIDWQLDFKSGYRWSERSWYLDVPIGHRPGVDVKVPWELARMQHLPQLALARVLAIAGAPGFADRDRYARSFRNQVLDFIATNPPRFGVNWRGTMDVAIRVANWLVAYDLFRASGFSFDAPFEATFARSVLDHALHIESNLEDAGGFRGNHYLANICGLLYATAWLAPDPRAMRSLTFAINELFRETDAQFLGDGGNFEASTSYHRLSAEMVFHATALIAAVRAKFPEVPAIPAEHWHRLRRIADFTRTVSKPNDLVPQIGDNDSGRFFKLSAVYERLEVDAVRRRFIGFSDYALPAGARDHWNEEFRDHRPMLALADAVLSAAGGDTTTEAAIVRQLCPAPDVGPVPTAAMLSAVQAPETPHLLARYRIEVPGAGLAVGVRHEALPEFGLYIIRSERLYLAVRCGPVGQNGRGGHAHNDQLGIELTIDGEDWISDPGTYLYTAAPEARNRYRSIAAHFAPRLGEREPSPLDAGLFWLPRDPQARCHRFAGGEFLGSHRGFGPVVMRHVRVSDDAIEITDTTDGSVATPVVTISCTGAAETRDRLQPRLPVSPAYGLQLA
jgi:hypothetical protein